MIEYSKLTAKELLPIYNEQAARLGIPPLKRPLERMAMVTATALVMARKPKIKPGEEPAPVKRRTSGLVRCRKPRAQPLRDYTVEMLCQIAHYETTDEKRVPPEKAHIFAGQKLYSVGFTYNQILANIKTKFPGSRITGKLLRQEASNVRHGVPGYTNGTLPDKRPRAKKGTSK